MSSTSTARWMARRLTPHVVAAGTSMLTAGVLTVALYVILLLVAVVTDKGIGSPVALPFWFVALVALAAACSLLLFAPAITVGERLARRVTGRWHRAAGLAWAVVVLWGFCLIVAACVAWRRPDILPLSAILVRSLQGVALLAFPFALYWAAFTGADVMLGVMTRLYRRACAAGLEPL